VAAPLFHIVLHQPEIPNNTGNIGRTCVATGCALHLIHPLGFDVSEKACRRAGLDYWPRLMVREHDSWDAYRGASRPARYWLFHPRSEVSIYEAELRRGDHLIFGRETAGLPPEILELSGVDAACQGRVYLPMAAGERSLNVATAVCAVVYEGVRRLLARGEARIGRQGELAVGEEDDG
jgi:tRNA (cytidine/uridine-2'-O-)-methyltransferase